MIYQPNRENIEVQECRDMLSSLESQNQNKGLLIFLAGIFYAQSQMEKQQLNEFVQLLQQFSLHCQNSNNQNSANETFYYLLNYKAYDPLVFLKNKYQDLMNNHQMQQKVLILQNQNEEITSQQILIINNNVIHEIEENEEEEKQGLLQEKDEKVEINYLPFQKYEVIQQNQRLCKICYEQDQDQQVYYSLKCCLNQFHITCLYECITAQQENNITPLKCPNFDCMKNIQEIDLKIFEASNVIPNRSFLDKNFSLNSGLQQQEVLEPSKYLNKVDQKQNCEICMLEMDQTVVQTLQCNHKYHKECLKAYFVYETQQKNFPLKCPQQECLRETLQQEVKEILNEQEYEKFENFQLQNYFEQNQSSIKNCLTPDCNYAFWQEQELVQYFECPVCMKEYCLVCNCEFHPNQTCEQYKMLKSQSQDKQFEDFAKNKLFQKCPSCKIWVEKNQGCDHMTCRCGYEFCYKCGGPHNKCDCNPLIIPYIQVQELPQFLIQPDVQVNHIQSQQQINYSNNNYQILNEQQQQQQLDENWYPIQNTTINMRNEIQNQQIGQQQYLNLISNDNSYINQNTSNVQQQQQFGFLQQNNQPQNLQDIDNNKQDQNFIIPNINYFNQDLERKSIEEIKANFEYVDDQIDNNNFKQSNIFQPDYNNSIQKNNLSYLENSIPIQISTVIQRNEVQNQQIYPGQYESLISNDNQLINQNNMNVQKQQQFGFLQQNSQPQNLQDLDNNQQDQNFIIPNNNYFNQNLERKSNQEIKANFKSIDDQIENNNFKQNNTFQPYQNNSFQKNNLSYENSYPSQISTVIQRKEVQNQQIYPQQYESLISNDNQQINQNTLIVKQQQFGFLQQYNLPSNLQNKHNNKTDQNFINPNNNYFNQISKRQRKEEIKIDFKYVDDQINNYNYQQNNKFQSDQKNSFQKINQIHIKNSQSIQNNITNMRNKVQNQQIQPQQYQSLNLNNIQYTNQCTKNLKQQQQQLTGLSQQRENLPNVQSQFITSSRRIFQKNKISTRKPNQEVPQYY
ncbi:hypothetical protein ABPG74_001495 [Tetrahymena malaccensis]